MIYYDNKIGSPLLYNLKYILLNVVLFKCFIQFFISRNYKRIGCCSLLGASTFIAACCTTKRRAQIIRESECLLLSTDCDYSRTVNFDVLKGICPSSICFERRWRTLCRLIYDRRDLPC